MIVEGVALLFETGIQVYRNKEGYIAWIRCVLTCDRVVKRKSRWAIYRLSVRKEGLFPMIPQRDKVEKMEYHAVELSQLLLRFQIREHHNQPLQQRNLYQLPSRNMTYLRRQRGPLRSQSKTSNNLNGCILLNLPTRIQRPQNPTHTPPIKSIRQYKSIYQMSNLLTCQAILFGVGCQCVDCVLQDLFVYSRSAGYNQILWRERGDLLRCEGESC